MDDRTHVEQSHASHHVLWSGFVGALAVGLSTAVIVALTFAVQSSSAVPPGAIGMFGLLGAVLGFVAGAVAGSSETGTETH